MTAQARGFSQYHRIQFLCMLTGHLHRLILTILALRGMHKKAVTGYGCVWVSCTELGGTHRPAEVIRRGDNLSGSWVDFLIEFLKQLIKCVFLWYVPFPALAVVLPAWLSTPKLYSSKPNILDGVRKKWVLGVSHTPGESSTCSQFSTWRKSWAEKVSIGIELCCLRRKVTQVK